MFVFEEEITCLPSRVSFSRDGVVGVFRAAEAKAASTCGRRETAAATTTATATATPPACGPSPSTRPSTTDVRPCTTRAAPPRWRPPSATAARETPRLALWVCRLPRDTNVSLKRRFAAKFSKIKVCWHSEPRKETGANGASEGDWVLLRFVLFKAESSLPWLSF